MTPNPLLSLLSLLFLLPLLLLANPAPAPNPLPPLPPTALSPRSQHLLHPPSPPQPAALKPPPGWADLQLLDTVLVGTIDGALHAVERSTGRRLWSRLVVGEGRGVVRVGPDSQGHGGAGEDADDAEGEQEQPEYIVDPYDGQLYTHTRAAPADEGGVPGGPQLQKLPLTMEQLIDLSPFSFPPSHTHLFLGSRTTSLFSLDLQTGESIGSFSTSPGMEDGFTVVRPGTKGTGREEEERERRREERCARDIRERPEDRLFIGQTDYHLAIHSTHPPAPPPTPDPSRSHPPLPLQQIHYSKLGPNQAYRELAAYWRVHGNVRGEVWRSRRGRAGGWGEGGEGEEDGEEEEEERFKTEVEMEERWRVEMTFDGTIIGLEQGKGHRWYTQLGSVAIAVYDILLPTTPLANPILLPQPPAYIPTLFPQEHMNLQLLAMEPVTYLSPLPLSSFASSASPARTKLPVFAMGSGNYPLILLAPRVQDQDGGGRVGAWGVVDSVEERLPLRIDEGREDVSRPEEALVEVGEGGGEEARVLQPVVREREREEKGRNMVWVWTMRAGVLLAFGAFLFFTGFGFGKKVMVRVREGEREVGAVSTELSQPLLVDSGPQKPDLAPAEVEKSLPPVPVDAETTTEGGDGDLRDASPEIPVPVSGPTSVRKPNARRRKRGRKKEKSDKGLSEDEEGEEGEGDDGSWELVKGEREKKEDKVEKREEGDGADKVETPPAKEVVIPPEHVVSRMEGLTVSDEVIGLGSHGTVVYKGVFQGRAVAVKRLLQDFVTVASQEVALLQASDDHQNVIRYFCQEKRDNFLYIALELCPASLGDIIESPDCYQELAVNFNPKRALFQVTSGLKYLHGLKIIHRDIKPQNVLVSVNKNGSQRMLLSDFGLAKRLDHGQSSYVQTGKHAIGSVGWRAPECLRGEVSLDELFEGSTPSGSGSSSQGDLSGAPKRGTGARLTKAVDLFALGCLYFYVLTGGGHPYGDRYEREINIVRDDKVGMVRLEGFEGQTEGEAGEIVKRLLSPVSVDRPDTTICLIHPLFWSPARRLSFLCDASDRFEIMELQPPEPTLVLLESKSLAVVGTNWHKRLDSVFLDNLGKHRKYDSKSVRDLLRALRNKKHHYQDLPDNVKRRLGSLPAGFLHYFTTRFPALFMHVHDVVYHSRLRRESMFASYFEVEE